MILHQRVLVRQGPRTGQKGIVSRLCPDGTIEVSFPIPQGGGCERAYYLPGDVRRLGPEYELQRTDPFETAFGPYNYWASESARSADDEQRDR